MLSLYTTHGDTDVKCEAAPAISSIVAWTALEVVTRVMEHRTPRCRRGCSIAGLKCPECGRTLG